MRGIAEPMLSIFRLRRVQRWPEDGAEMSKLFMDRSLECNNLNNNHIKSYQNFTGDLGSLLEPLKYNQSRNTWERSRLGRIKKSQKRSYNMSNTRRQFIYQICTIGPSAILAIGLTGCGNIYRQGEAGDGTDSSGGEPLANCPSGVGTQYANPGHPHSTLTITNDQVRSAVPGNYTVLGGGHSHTIQLTAQDFAEIEQGGTITKTVVGSHGHIVQIGC